MKATTTITIEVKGTTLALTRDEARQLMQALQAEIGALPQPRQQFEPISEIAKKLERHKQERDRQVICQPPVVTYFCGEPASLGAGRAITMN